MQKKEAKKLIEKINSFARPYNICTLIEICSWTSLPQTVFFRLEFLLSRWDCDEGLFGYQQLHFWKVFPGVNDLMSSVFIWGRILMMPRNAHTKFFPQKEEKKKKEKKKKMAISQGGERRLSRFLAK